MRVSEGSSLNIWARWQVFQRNTDNSWQARRRSELISYPCREEWVVCCSATAALLRFVVLDPLLQTCCVCVLQKLGSSMQCEEGTDWLLELLMELQLQQYFLRIRDDLNVTRLSHFDYVKNEDLEKIGMGRPGESLKWLPVPVAQLYGLISCFPACCR